MNFQSLLNRIKALLLKPKETWPEIEADPVTPQSLLVSMVIPLAVFSALCAFIGLVVVGVSVPLIGSVKWPVGSGFSLVLLSLVLGIGGVFLTAFVVDALAPNFAAEKNFNQSFKLVAFSMVPGWMAGIFQLVPKIF